MFCKNCGQELPEGTRFCTGCGAQTAMEAQQAQQQTPPEQPAQQIGVNTKFCKHCGGKIPEKAVVCTLCGCQVEEIQNNQGQPNVVINNSNSNVNSNVNANFMPYGRMKNKWVALVLCIFLGMLGGHKFYEGKVGMGILYLFTGGLFFIGVLIDFIAILGKPNPYYV